MLKYFVTNADQILTNITTMTADQSINRTQNIYLPLVLTGAIIGALLSGGVLSGDELGRVNLLYILVLYFLIPVLTLFITIIALISGKSSTSLTRILHSSFFDIQSNDYYRLLRQKNLGSIWILEQIQLFVISFSIMSLITFFLLLLFTDVSIVWRSTILTPEDLYPVLQFIAMPWQFWFAAQPSIEILQATQDFRTSGTVESNLSLVAWWPFVVAVQLTYAIIPRLLIYWMLKLKLSRQIVTDSSESVTTTVDAEIIESNSKTQFVSQIDSKTQCITWDKIPNEFITKLKTTYPLLSFGDNTSWSNGSIDIPSSPEFNKPIIIVKSWEAPMAELADQLTNSTGYLLPINWHKEQLIKPLDIHIDEWSRFCRELNWQLVVLDETHYD